MGFDFVDDKPIYLQIIDYVKTQIITKAYLPNEKIPSVRELALLFGVNPNTVQKALTELEEGGLIYTESTNGKYVTGDCEKIKKETYSTIKELVNNFAQSMNKFGVTKEQILEIIKECDL